MINVVMDLSESKIELTKGIELYNAIAITIYDI